MTRLYMLRLKTCYGVDKAPIITYINKARLFAVGSKESPGQIENIDIENRNACMSLDIGNLGF